MRLPLSLMLVGSGALQWTRYPAGILPTLLHPNGEDDEAHNTVSLKVTKPLGGGWSVEVRGAIYQNYLQQDQTRYLRHLFTAGVAYRTEKN